MASTETDIYKTPRYFWRRLFAYALDVLIAWFVAAVVLGIFESDDLDGNMAAKTFKYTFGIALNSDEFRPPLYLGSVTCGPATPILAFLRHQVAPATISSAEFCVERSFGIPVAISATATLADTPEAGDLGGQKVNIPLRIPSFHRFADTIAFGIFLCLSVLTTRLLGRSVGKKFMGLEIVGRSPVPTLRREMIRNLPHLLVVPTFALINWMLPPLPAVPPAVQTLAIGLQILSAGAFIFLWLVPLVRWRGNLPHDRWFGTKVVRSDRSSWNGHGDSGGPQSPSLPSEGFTGLPPTMGGRPRI